MPIFELGHAISVKSCVKILFRLVEPFKSYRGNIQKQKNFFLNTPRLGGLHLTLILIFEFGWPIPVKSHVWKFDLDWLKSEVC